METMRCKRNTESREGQSSPDCWLLAGWLAGWLISAQSCLRLLTEERISPGGATVLEAERSRSCPIYPTRGRRDVASAGAASERAAAGRRLQSLLGTVLWQIPESFLRRRQTATSAPGN